MSDHRLTRPKRGLGLYLDPLYGNVPLPIECRELIDLPSFQRMRYQKQLALIHLGLPGAMHSRFEHSIGVYYLSVRALEVIRAKYVEWKNWHCLPQNKEAPEITEHHVLALSLASLLHDIGHGPFSHVFDFFLKTCYSTDTSMPRDHEVATRLIIEGKIESCPDIPDLLNHVYKQHNEEPILKPEVIGRLATGEPLPDEIGDEYTFLSQIITQSWGTDRLDYLRRDALHTGVETGRIDIWNIINSYMLRPPHDELDDENDTTHRGWNLALESSAAIWLEAMLGTRDLTFRLMCYNDSNRVATEMMLRAMIYWYESQQEALAAGDSGVDPEGDAPGATGEQSTGAQTPIPLWEKLWKLDDHEMLKALDGCEVGICRTIAKKIENRDLYEAIPLRVKLSQDLNQDARRVVKDLLDDMNLPESFRHGVIRAEQDIAREFEDVLAGETVILDIHQPPLEKAKTYKRKYLYDSKRDEFVCLLDLCSHLRPLRETLDLGALSGEPPLKMDELYRSRMNDLRLLWPYEFIERTAKEAIAKQATLIDADADNEEAIEIDEEQLVKDILDRLIPLAKGMLDKLHALVRMSSEEKRSATEARLNEGLQRLSKTIADGVLNRLKGSAAIAKE